ncbi:MAG TPA: hypothetical protein P5531_03655 [Bacteroidales bacterium]|nr:hypothetical protein [Bacteroidales bacterium]HSA42383.1 hypothetical protein [Bacteroidales bacterium]
MKPVLIAGISIVNLALIFYSIAILTQLRKKILYTRVLVFLTLGLVFDITATICMILGSDEGPVTLHGMIGYSSLLGMMTDALFSFRKVSRNGLGTPVDKRFNRWSLTAWLYWIAAYITGALIIMMR